MDDELEQLHCRIGQASGGFDKEDGEVIRVCGEIPEDGPIPSYLVCGWGTELGCGYRGQLNGRKPEAESDFPGRDAGDGENGRVDLEVEGKEGGQIGLKLGDASQVTDPGRNTLADDGKSRPAG